MECCIIEWVKKMETTNHTTYYSYLHPHIHVGGLIYFKKEIALQRLSKKDQIRFEDINPTISRLSTHTSGVYLEFQTDSSYIDIQVELSHASYLPHMSVIAQAGFCLYYLQGNKWIFIGSSKVDQKDFIYRMIEGLSTKQRTYRLYFPLYVGVNDIKIGLDKESKLQEIHQEESKKIICYGTSITQGACASRAGMSYTSIVSRTVRESVYNFGFSGSANLEVEMAKIIANIENMSHLVIEVSANAGQSQFLYERFEAFMDEIVRKHPKLPILLISPFPNPHRTLFDNVEKTQESNIRFYQEKLKCYPQITYLDMNDRLLKFEYEETVDAVHLTDLGFLEIANEVIGWIDKSKRVGV